MLYKQNGSSQKIYAKKKAKHKQVQVKKMSSLTDQESRLFKESPDIMERTTLFVFKNGLEFEGMIIKDTAKNPKYNFFTNQILIAHFTKIEVTADYDENASQHSKPSQVFRSTS